MSATDIKGFDQTVELETIDYDNLPNICHIEECELIYFHDLPEEIQRNFDWEGAEESGYFHHRNSYYCLDNIMRYTSGALLGKDDDGNLVEFTPDGIESDCYFHAVLVQFNESGDGVIAADLYC